MKPLRLKAIDSCELRSWTAAGSSYRPVSLCNGTKRGHLKHTALAYHSLIGEMVRQFGCYILVGLGGKSV